MTNKADSIEEIEKWVEQEEDGVPQADVPALLSNESYLQQTVTRATRGDYSAYDRAELEVMLSRQDDLLTGLQSQIQRDNLAPALWAQAANLFNDLLAGQPENDLALPLIERAQEYLKRIDEPGIQFENDLKGE